MGSIDRYIFRTTLASFALVLVSLTGVIWITQALRGIDLMTSQGQTILTFLGITGLVIPALILVISPIALMISISHTLNKLATDSEIIVMNAAGMPPWFLFRPFLAAGIVVSLLVAAISTYVSPWGLRELRRWATEVRADLVSNIVQPGRYIKLEERLTLHIRERRPNGQLLGIFIDDQRDPKERASILAEQGDIVKNERGLFLVLENGSVQRHETGQRDPIPDEPAPGDRPGAPSGDLPDALAGREVEFGLRLVRELSHLLVSPCPTSPTPGRAGSTTAG